MSTGAMVALILGAGAVYQAIWLVALHQAKRRDSAHIDHQEETSHSRCDRNPFCGRPCHELDQQKHLHSGSEARREQVNDFERDGHVTSLAQSNGDKKRRDHLSEQRRNVRIHESPSSKNAPARTSGEGEDK